MTQDRIKKEPYIVFPKINQLITLIHYKSIDREDGGVKTGNVAKSCFERIRAGNTVVFLTEAQKSLFWKEYVFGRLISFIRNNCKPFSCFFTFNKPDYQYSCKGKTRGN